MWFHVTCITWFRNNWKVLNSTQRNMVTPFKIICDMTWYVIIHYFLHWNVMNLLRLVVRFDLVHIFSYYLYFIPTRFFHRGVLFRRFSVEVFNPIQSILTQFSSTRASPISIQLICHKFDKNWCTILYNMFYVVWFVFDKRVLCFLHFFIPTCYTGDFVKAEFLWLRSCLTWMSSGRLNST